MADEKRDLRHKVRRVGKNSNSRLAVVHLDERTAALDKADAEGARLGQGIVREAS